ncbi:hypothetical protein [Streptomyces cucumeris]|uniref:hypothetical protein n=1 Tax=Streptomyces cucumeris TaxID=2962890 RepID=UPI003D728F24
MWGNGAEQRGHVLLIAGDRAVHRRTVQVLPSGNLAALATVPTPVLLGDAQIPADLVHLDGVTDQNSLRLRLSIAAAAPGPLLMYLSGRLTTDRKTHEIYLALTSTTGSNTRYAALPWTWIHAELSRRPPGTSTLLLDLVADKHAWPLVQEYGALSAASSVEVFGAIAPPDVHGSGSGQISPYTRTWIDQLRRNPQRPTNARLHALTVGAAALPPGTLIVPSAQGSTVPAVAARQAAQQTTRPPMTNLQRILAGDADFIRSLHRRRRDTAPETPPAPRPDLPIAPPAPTAPQPTPAAPTPPYRQQRAELAEPPRIPAQAPVPVQQPQPSPAAQPDPRPHIYALAQQGQFNEASQLAQAWETDALQTYGITSPQATQWVEIRADLAKQQENFLLATQLWISAGRTRLAHQPADAPEVVATGKSAHYCWNQISDHAKARECGPELISLLRALPSLDRRHLSTAQQRLEFLGNAPSRR